MTTVVLVLAALLVLNALLAASELAVMTSRPSRLQAMASKGSASARTALSLAHNPTRFLSTVQLGITLVAILAGAYGERTLAGAMQHWLAEHHVPEQYTELISLTVVVAAITYVTLVIGELVPKRLALAYPERVAMVIAPPLRVLSWLALPAVTVLSGSTDALVKVLGVRTRADDVSEDDVKALVARAASTGVFDPLEHKLFERAMRVNDLTARSLMVPRTQVMWIDESMPVEDVRVLIGTAPFSHFPVCQGGMDKLKGVVHVKDLISYGLLQGTDFKVAAVAQQPHYVPESMPALRLLEHFRTHRTRVAFVVDEHGSIEGLVTANDVVQAIVGDLSRHGEEESPQAVRRADGSWLLDGRLPAAEAMATLGLPVEALDELPDVATAAGLVTALIGDLPTTGQRVDWMGWTFEVVDLDGQRVDKLLATRIGQV
ncbi:MAG: hemolysin family protein [Phycisphaerales bacterium]